IEFSGASSPVLPLPLSVIRTPYQFYLSVHTILASFTHAHTLSNSSTKILKYRMQLLSIAQTLTQITSQLESLSIAMSDKASKDSKVISLTKFAPDDYHLWAAQSEATFIVHKVWEIITGTEQNPSPTIPDDGSSVADTDVNAAITSTMRKKIAS